jgi:SAM-dependent methyltransferase
MNARGLQRGMQRVLGTVSPHVPLSVKRPIKQRIPKPYYRFIDPYWHRRAIGGKWEELGELQFDWLVGRGLQPHHYLLDVGCGPLRGGSRFIRYLEPGHYFGIDRREDLVAAAIERELVPNGLDKKSPSFIFNEVFDFQAFAQQFDYAIAQSVFTHLTVNQIIRCLMNMEEVLSPGGTFFATFYENKEGKRNLDPVEQKPGLRTHFDQDFFHYDFATFEWAVSGTSLRVEYLGEWNNPRNQRMLAFTKAG